MSNLEPECKHCSSHLLVFVSIFEWEQTQHNICPTPLILSLCNTHITAGGTAYGFVYINPIQFCLPLVVFLNISYTVLVMGVLDLGRVIFFLRIFLSWAQVKKVEIVV